MSVRRLAEIQPESFAFTSENQAWADQQIAKYPPGRQASAVISLLWRAQKQNAYWLPQAAIEDVARILDMPKIRVLEVATFYTMFNLAPVGRYYVQLCGTTPCMLRGAEDIKAVLHARVGEPGHVTADGLFSWNEVECLGACCNAPMVQINDDYYEDLTPENFSKLLDNLAAGRPVTIGSQIGRGSSEPVGKLTALATLYGADGKSGPDSFPPANDPHVLVPAPAPPATAPLASASPAPAEPGPAPESPSAAPPKPAAEPAPETVLALAPIGSEHAAPQLGESEAQAHALAEEAHINETLAKLPADATSEQKANAVGARPLALPAPRNDAADDLQRIRGIGPVNEKHLHDLGIFHFDQIVAWTRAEIRWVGTYLSFPGRIDREQWTAQAANLAQGGAGPKDGASPVPLDPKPGN